MFSNVWVWDENENDNKLKVKIHIVYNFKNDPYKTIKN